MNFMKCHFKEWMWVAITIQSGFLVDGMASFVHPAVGETANPQKYSTGLRRSCIHIHERPLCCAVEERRRREIFLNEKPCFNM